MTIQNAIIVYIFICVSSKLFSKHSHQISTKIQILASRDSRLSISRLGGDKLIHIINRNKSTPYQKELLKFQ